MAEVDWLERWHQAESREFPQLDRPRETVLFGSVDALDRKIPRRLEIADYLLLIARSEPARVRRVPASAVVEEAAEDETEVAYVTCPCGAHPVARPALEKCVGCERHYVRFEQTGMVFVCYGDMEPPLLQPPAPVH